MSLEFEHHQMVQALAKPGGEIIKTLTPSTAHLLHMAVGVAGEAGELLDAVKKAAVYNKPLDRANVVEELGDLEFYMEGLRDGAGITREETLKANITKLSKRYAAGRYSDQQAQARADKVDEQTTNPGDDMTFIGTIMAQSIGDTNIGSIRGTVLDAGVSDSPRMTIIHDFNSGGGGDFGGGGASASFGDSGSSDSSGGGE